jgi:hypothetical protein
VDHDARATMRKRPLPSWLVTLLIVATYAALMASTNTRFTMLDDESNSIAIAGRPVAHALRPFLFGDGYRELHPPATEIHWHLWMVVTHYSFALLRLPANLFFIGAIFFTAKCAEKLAGRNAYWATLLVGLAWPFAFQYGRIAGWYTLSTLLLAIVTWLYLQILEDTSRRWWGAFAAACVLFVWSNYFGFVFLALLAADLVIFHRAIALRRLRPLAFTTLVVAASFLPLLRVAFSDVGEYVRSPETGISIRHEIAAVGYPTFAIFGSAAVAPWFLPLSLPILIGALLLAVAVWRSTARRWLLYVACAMLAMELARVYDIKRVLIFLPWIFLAIGLTVARDNTRNPWLARGAVFVLVLTGWIGILSGNHDATTNLHEPWGKVAGVVAEDARHGATIISENPPFFLYLDYELGLQSMMQSADSSDLGADFYRAHGYAILNPDETGKSTNSLRGKIVLVNGSGEFADVQAMNALKITLAHRCSTLGEYRAAPDPALTLKRRFTTDVPVLPYRTHVTWFDCN